MVECAESGRVRSGRGRWHAAVSGFVVPLLLAAAGCDSTVEPEEDGAPPILTDGLSFQLEEAGEVLKTEIPYTYQNRTGTRIYLVNCNGTFGAHLERSTSGGWQTAWSPAMFLCLSPPIVIRAGETVAFTLHVYGGLPGGRLWPQFETEDPSGVYRIVWDGAVFDYRERYPFGRPVPFEQRVSNPFTLEK